MNKRRWYRNRGRWTQRTTNYRNWRRPYSKMDKARLTGAATYEGIKAIGHAKQAFDIGKSLIPKSWYDAYGYLADTAKFLTKKASGNKELKEFSRGMGADDGTSTTDVGWFCCYYNTTTNKWMHRAHIGGPYENNCYMDVFKNEKGSLNFPTIGTASNQMIGRSIRVKSLFIRVDLRAAALDVSSPSKREKKVTKFRIIVFQDKKANGKSAGGGETYGYSVGSLLNHVGKITTEATAEALIDAYYNLDYPGRFKVFFDKVFYLYDKGAYYYNGVSEAYAPSVEEKRVNINLRPNLVVKYTAGGAVVNNPIRILILPDAYYDTDGIEDYRPSCCCRYRFRFWDD